MQSELNNLECGSERAKRQTNELRNTQTSHNMHGVTSYEIYLIATRA